MHQLQPVETLVVDIAIDNLSDNYSSKPSHISPEFNNVMAAGATEISGSTLCCAQLGLALVLTAVASNQRHTLLFDAGPEGAIFLRNCRNLGVSLADVEAIAISHGHWDHMGALLDTLDHITRHNNGPPGAVLREPGDVPGARRDPDERSNRAISARPLA